VLRWSDVVSRCQNLADAKIALERGWLDARDGKAVEEFLTQRQRDEQRDYQLFWGNFSTRWRILSRNIGLILRKRRLSEITYAAMPRPLYRAALRAVAAYRGIFVLGDCHHQT
jgi:hypothetical protein